MKKFHDLYKGLSPTQLRAAVSVLAFAVVGTVLLLTSHAATPTASLEAENGTVSSGAIAVSDSTASGSQAVKFGASGGATGNCTGTSETPGGADPWGSCWPGPNNTGVPAGTTLTVVNGDLTVSTDNTVVSAKDVRGCIDIEAVGVTVKNSKAQCIGTSNNARARDPANARLTIQDSQITDTNQDGSSCVGDKNITVYRTNISGCENGFDADSDITIIDSYIHDLHQSVVAHTDGLQSAVGSNIIITHNVFYGDTFGACGTPSGHTNNCGGTSAVNINNNSSGPHSSNTTVNNNLLAGGAYTLYCPIPSTTNFKVQNNHFSNIFYPSIGAFGPTSDCGDEITSGNVYHETGLPVPMN